jgi:plasmid stabilization system protein ParE
MQNGYKLFWSDRAFADLQNIITYLTENWTQREIQNFVRRFDKRLNLITNVLTFLQRQVEEKI